MSSLCCWCIVVVVSVFGLAVPAPRHQQAAPKHPHPSPTHQHPNKQHKQDQDFIHFAVLAESEPPTTPSTATATSSTDAAAAGGGGGGGGHTTIRYLALRVLAMDVQLDWRSLLRYLHFFQQVCGGVVGVVWYGGVLGWGDGWICCSIGRGLT